MANFRFQVKHQTGQYWVEKYIQAKNGQKGRKTNLKKLGNRFPEKSEMKRTKLTGKMQKYGIIMSPRSCKGKILLKFNGFGEGQFLRKFSLVKVKQVYFRTETHYSV